MVNSGLGEGAGFTCSKLPSRPLASSTYRLQLLFALTKTCVTERPLLISSSSALCTPICSLVFFPSLELRPLQPRFSRMFWFLSDSDANAFRACKMFFYESAKKELCFIAWTRLIPGHEFSEQLVPEHVHVVQDGEVQPGAAAVGALPRVGFGRPRAQPGILYYVQHFSLVLLPFTYWNCESIQQRDPASRKPCPLKSMSRYLEIQFVSISIAFI